MKQIRSESGLTQAEFGEAVFLTRAQVVSYELDKVIPADSTLLVISQHYKVDLEWLRTGEGDPFPPQTEEEELSAILASVVAEGDSEKIRFAKAVMGMLFEGWPIVKKHMEALKAEEDSRAEKTNN